MFIRYSRCAELSPIKLYSRYVLFNGNVPPMSLAREPTVKMRQSSLLTQVIAVDPRNRARVSCKCSYIYIHITERRGM